jgi:hypothetical protein
MLFVCSQVCDSCNGLYKILSFAQSFDQFFVYSTVWVTYYIWLLNGQDNLSHLRLPKIVPKSIRQYVGMLCPDHHPRKRQDKHGGRHLVNPILE